MTAALALGAMVAAAAAAAGASSQGPAIRIEPGVTFVLAVDDRTTRNGKSDVTVQGGYEMAVAITGVTAEAITHAVAVGGLDAAGTRRHGTIRRVVSSADLAHSRIQVLGFHSGDPDVLSGTTSLGPSLEVVRDLRETGSAAYSFLNFVSQGLVSGTLTRTAGSPARFAVWLDDRRVEVDAIHATGQMSLGGEIRPFEMVILDHPQCPLSLRVAYGPPGAGFPFTPDFVREIVRIELAGDRRDAPLVSDLAVPQ